LLASVVLVYFVVNMFNPPLSVSFIKSISEQEKVPGAIQYDFKVKVNVPSSMNFPFGKQASVTAIHRALKPLLDKYDLVTDDYEDFDSTGITAAWSYIYTVDGESTFSLYSYETFSYTQIESLTNDLLDALTVAMDSNLD
jgi:hypothetical protein